MSQPSSARLGNNRASVPSGDAPGRRKNRIAQPGKPLQNGYIESFFGKLPKRTAVLKLQSALEDCQGDYNDQPPRLGLGMTPLDSRRFAHAKQPKRIGRRSRGPGWARNKGPVKAGHGYPRRKPDKTGNTSPPEWKDCYHRRNLGLSFCLARPQTQRQKGLWHDL